MPRSATTRASIESSTSGCVRRQSFETLRFYEASTGSGDRFSGTLSREVVIATICSVLGVKGPKLRERQVQGDVFERYRKSLQRRGLRVHRVEGDGNCLFRSAVSHQVYGDDKHHGLAPKECGRLHEF